MMARVPEASTRCIRQAFTRFATALPACDVQPTKLPTASATGLVFASQRHPSNRALICPTLNSLSQLP